MQVAMLVALHLLYAAIGLLDAPSRSSSTASHFAQQSWVQTLRHKVRSFFILWAVMQLLSASTIRRVTYAQVTVEAVGSLPSIESLINQLAIIRYTFERHSIAQDKNFCETLWC